jgi:XTP/dITP diphosphohydrolase
VTDLLVATNNPGKLDEFRRLLADLPARVFGPSEAGIELEVAEPYPSYAENAAAKAAAFCHASGLLTLADDSGIEVAALGWGPGPRSARYGGPQVADRAALLLERVADATDRRARMVCALALAIPPSSDAPAAVRDAVPQVEIYSGVIEGRLARAPRGAGGFGYDPIFELASGKTTAELPAGEKDRISHRGRAVAAAGPRLRELLGARVPQ